MEVDGVCVNSAIPALLPVHCSPTCGALTFHEEATRVRAAFLRPGILRARCVRGALWPVFIGIVLHRTVMARADVIRILRQQQIARIISLVHRRAVPTAIGVHSGDQPLVR